MTDDQEQVKSKGLWISFVAETKEGCGTFLVLILFAVIGIAVMLAFGVDPSDEDFDGDLATIIGAATFGFLLVTGLVTLAVARKVRRK